MLERIALESKNKDRLEKLVVAEKKKKEVRKSQLEKDISAAQEAREREKEAQRKLDTELLHQTEESTRRSLVKKMMSDAASNSPTLNQSCLKVLNNFQGNLLKLLSTMTIKKPISDYFQAHLRA